MNKKEERGNTVTPPPKTNPNAITPIKSVKGGRTVTPPPPPNQRPPKE